MKFIIIFFISLSAFAQTIDDIVPDFSPEQEAQISEGFGTYVSATTVFTARNAASTGTFSVDGGEYDFNVTNIPVTYKFDNGFQIRGALGRFEAKSSFYDLHNLSEELSDAVPELDFPNAPDFRKDLVHSLTLGAGYTFQLAEGLEIVPSFDFIWTHVKRRFDYNNFLSTLLGLKYDREIFNYSTEAISYSPGIEVTYKAPLGDGYFLTPSVLYTHIWTEDLWSKSEYGEFSIDSGLLQGTLTLNIPISSEVDLRPFSRATLLDGAVKESLAEDLLYDFGANFAFDLEGSILSELSIGAAYIYASDFDGYRISISGEY